MNFPLLLPLIVTATLAVAGWYAVHRLSMNRDQENKRRDLRIQAEAELRSAARTNASGPT